MSKSRVNKPSIREKLSKILKNILLFCVIQIVIVIVYSIPMVYYGPFNNIRNMLVTTAMTTLNHQYIVTTFLSENKINEIMNENKIYYEDKKTDATRVVVNDSYIKKGEDQVKLINITKDKFKGYVILVKNPRMVSVASTDSVGTKGMLLEDMVKKNKAFGAINSGGFGEQGSGGIPIGLLISNGKVLYGDDGQRYALVGFNEDSVLVLGSYNAKEALENKIRNAVSFGPYLIVNGTPLIKGDSNGGWGMQPRTAIGQKKDGTVIMLVIDGRQPGYSMGATLKDVEDIMLDYGAYNAANLDGGSSSTLVYGGKVINRPCSATKDRYIPSAFIISK